MIQSNLIGNYKQSFDGIELTTLCEYKCWAFSAFGGGFGGFGGAGANGALTRAEMYDGFTMNNIERQIQGVQNGLCSGFYDLNTTALQGFNRVNSAIAENRQAKERITVSFPQTMQLFEQISKTDKTMENNFLKEFLKDSLEEWYEDLENKMKKI